MSYSIAIIILVTSVATYISRLLGVLTSERLSSKSKVFDWFNYVAYSILAALMVRMIIFPNGALQDAEISSRIIVTIICLSVFVLTKKNLVIPTILSFLLLTIFVVGGILGPIFYLFTPEWSILISGFIGGSLAFLIKEKK